MMDNEKLWNLMQERLDRLEDRMTMRLDASDEHTNTRIESLGVRVGKLEGIAKTAGVIGTGGLAIGVAALSHMF